MPAIAKLEKALLARMSVSGVEIEDEPEEQKSMVESLIDNDQVNLPWSMKIGGLLGIGSKLIEANFSLNKTRYYPGETVKLKIDIDNRKCSKDVKSYKVKLWRRWTIYDQ